MISVDQIFIVFARYLKYFSPLWLDCWRIVILNIKPDKTHKQQSTKATFMVQTFKGTAYLLFGVWGGGRQKEMEELPKFHSVFSVF